MMAAFYGHLEVVAKLAELGVNPFAGDNVSPAYSVILPNTILLTALLMLLDDCEHCL